MTITVDFCSNKPLYKQIKDAIICAISAGQLHEGDSLPSVRQLANDVGVNMLTINKVYTILKQEGYITINKKSGALVSRNLEADTQFLESVKAQIMHTATQARSRNISRKDFVKMCDDIYAQLERGNSD